MSASPQGGRDLHQGARISRETSAAAVIPETGHRAPYAALPHGAVRMALSSSRTCGKCEHFLSLSCSHFQSQIKYGIAESQRDSSGDAEMEFPSGRGQLHGEDRI